MGTGIDSHTEISESDKSSPELSGGALSNMADADS